MIKFFIQTLFTHQTGFSTMNLINKTTRNKGFFTLIIGFCFLISNPIQAQDITWTGGGGDGDWNNAANWSLGSVPTTNQWIEIGAASSPVVTISSGTVNVSKLNIVGDATGSAKLIIASGATLNVLQTDPSTGGASGIALGVIGGTVENSGTLNVSSSFATAGEAIRIGATAASSKLDNKAGATLSASTATGSGNTINFSAGTSTFTANGTISLNAAAGKYVINIPSGATNATIDGAGFTLPSANLALITQAGGGSALTIETGTTLTSNGISTGTNAILLNPSTGTATLTNKGTININGSCNAGVRMAPTGTAGLSTFDNQGTLTFNATTGSGLGGIAIASGAYTYAITNSGTMSLTNNLAAGAAFQSTGTAGSTVTVTNSGTLTLAGKGNVALGATTTITNTGTITTNYALTAGTVNNNTNGILNFTKDANSTTASQTAITSTLTNSGTINTNTGAASGTNPLTSLTGTTTINASSVLSPGGNAGKGEMKISGATVTLNGTLKLQASGTASVGVDFDRITANSTNGTFNATNATIDLTDTYVPTSTSATTIAVIVANGATSNIAGTAPAVTNGRNWTAVVDNVSSPRRINIVFTPSVPDAPTIGTATASGTTTSVAFTAPTFTGGPVITGYTVTAYESDGVTPVSPAITATGTSSPITVTGLTIGNSYRFKVSATNGIGTGAESVASSLVVLPVELVSFTATPLSKTNKLTWVTATELNNKGFDIQRSPQPPKGAFDKWETLGFVKAEGKAATYTFEDNAPLSISYYRLRQVDFDGKETFSKVVSVSQTKGGSLSITPNPTSDKIQISVPNDASSDQTMGIRLYDLSGRQVLSQKSNGANTSLDLSNLAKGVYLLEVQAQKTIYREKVVRQ